MRQNLFLDGCSRTIDKIGRGVPTAPWVQLFWCRAARWGHRALPQEAFLLCITLGMSYNNEDHMKHLLSLEKMSAGDMRLILQRSTIFKKDRPGAGRGSLANQSWAMLFSKSSTRTLISIGEALQSLTRRFSPLRQLMTTAKFAVSSGSTAGSLIRRVFSACKTRRWVRRRAPFQAG